MDDHVTDAQCCEQDNGQCQIDDKDVKETKQIEHSKCQLKLWIKWRFCSKYNDLLVVTFADTCAQPDAMMVKLHYTVIAQVAMAAARGSEYETSLTELEFKEERGVCQVHLHIVDSVLMTHIQVLIGQEAFDGHPAPRWHDSRLSCGSMYHKEIC